MKRSRRCPVRSECAAGKSERTKLAVSLKKWLKKEYGCYLFLIPAFIGFFVFSVYPMFSSLFYAFTDFNGMKITQIGTMNFETIFSGDIINGWPEVGKSLGLSILLSVISIPMNLVLSYILALFLYKEVKGSRFFRLLYYLPVVVPGIAMGLLWIDVFNPESNGIMNQIFAFFGLPQSQFFQSADSSLATYISTGLWVIGGNMIMWLAALNNISPDIIEAAKIDGAGYFRRLLVIVIPLCTPILFYNLINGIIATLQTFDSYAMVGSGVENSLYFIAVRIYVTGFKHMQMGLACAEAWLLFIMIAACTLVMFRFSKWVFYYDDEN